MSSGWDSVRSQRENVNVLFVVPEEPGFRQTGREASMYRLWFRQAGGKPPEPYYDAPPHSVKNAALPAITGAAKEILLTLPV